MKTPLYYQDDDGVLTTFDADGVRICDSQTKFPYAYPVGPERQARIVACVNACAGMDDPEAEIAALRSLVKELANALRMTVSDPDALDGRPRTWEVVQEVLAKLPAPGQAWSEFFTGANP